MKPYSDYKVYGPYRRKTDNRYHVIAIDKEGKRKTISYPKYLMEMHLNRYLLRSEEVHHIDENVTNNDLSNLEVKDGAEHKRLHKTKYFNNIIVKCIWCNKQITLTPKQQSTRTREIRRKNVNGPFCSKSCSGKYGAYIQNKSQ